MTCGYKKTVAGRNFEIKKDYFGNWAIWSRGDNFEQITGAPAFSVGHRTKKDAMNFLETFAD